MRLGIVLWADRDIGQLAALGARAEDVGFDDVWWPDHYMQRDVGATLTASALATERVRLGTAVTSPMLRHPGALGSLFASLGEIAPGRIVAGVGPGGWELPTQLGIEQPRPFTATRDALAVMTALMRGERVTTAGSTFPVTDAGLDFVPPAPIPVYLAARGPRMMGLAGEVADGCITHSLSTPFIERVVERVTAGANRGNRDAASCEIAVWVEIVLDADVDRARDALRGRCLYMVGGEYSPEMIPLYGLDPEQVMPVREAVRRRDPAAPSLITDEMVDAFSICGSVSRAADRIAALEAAGVGQLILSVGHGATEADVVSAGEAVMEVIG